MKKLILTALSSLLLLIFIYGVGFTIFATHAISPIKASEEKSDAAIILTGGENRVKEGVELLNNQQAKHIFISGVGEKISLNEILPETYISVACCVTLGYEAKDTIGNAEEAYKWLEENKEIESFHLVTSSYHIPRAYQIFKNHKNASKYKITLYPISMNRLSPDKREFWNLMFEEYNKLIFTWMTIEREEK